MKIICIARNYAAHAEELDRQVGGGTPCPPEPAWFLKPDTALLRNNDRSTSPPSRRRCTTNASWSYASTA